MRYSLRTLLILMALASIYAAWMRYASQVSEYHRIEANRLIEEDTNYREFRRHRAMRDTYEDAAFAPWRLLPWQERENPVRFR